MNSVADPSPEEEKALLVDEDKVDTSTLVGDITDDILFSPDDTPKSSELLQVTTPSEESSPELPKASHTPITFDSPKPTKIAKLSALENMTPAERSKLRRSKFSSTPSSLEKEQKAPPAVKTTLPKQDLQDQPAKSPTTPSLDVLKKRAERFGNNVSTLMKELEEKERLQKRKQRFTSSPTLKLNTKCSISALEDPKKRISSISSLSEEEKKLMRKKRFNL